MIINPGSGPIKSGEGWTNTLSGAMTEALRWYDGMLMKGFTDVVMLTEPEERDGRWVFGFRHEVTGVVVELETHGIDDVEAYEKAHIFAPRVYWNGCSTSTPRLEDWKADGFEPVRTYRRVSS